MSTIRFQLEKNGQLSDLDVVYDELYAIGYAGRNKAKTMEHIQELKERFGVPAPLKIPTIFQMSTMLLTQDLAIDFIGHDSCGEVEYVIITQGEKVYIGVGSDHTDRKLEGSDVPKAKQVCPKPVGRIVWDYDDLKDHWDEIQLKSYQTVDGKESIYQEGGVKDILPVETILDELNKRVGPVQSSVIFSGTVPVKSGFVFGTDFRGEMIDPVLKRTLTFRYSVKEISEEER
jgi:hypothetical protein